MIVDIGDVHRGDLETDVLQVALADVDHLGDEDVLVLHHLFGGDRGDRIAQMSFDDVACHFFRLSQLFAIESTLVTARIRPARFEEIAKLTVAFTFRGTTPAAIAESTTTSMVYGVRSSLAKRLRSGMMKTRPPLDRGEALCFSCARDYAEFVSSYDFHLGEEL